MNARLPTFALATANPELDAARYENDREDNDEWSQEAARQAPLIILKRLQGTAPTDWFKKRIEAAGAWSADEIVLDAVADCPEAAEAHAELMASPAAQKLRQLSAEWLAKRHHLAIYHDHCEEERRNAA